MNKNRSGRRYDREFKNNAVALVRGGAQSPRWPEIWASLNGRWGTGRGVPRRARRSANPSDA